MLAILARACVLASVVLAAVPQLLAQQVINFVDSGCEEIHRTFAPVNPRRSADEAIIPGQIVMQLDLKLSMKTRVVVTEYPDTVTMALSARGVSVWLARYRRPSSPSIAFRFTHIVSHN